MGVHSSRDSRAAVTEKEYRVKRRFIRRFRSCTEFSRLIPLINHRFPYIRRNEGRKFSSILFSTLLSRASVASLLSWNAYNHAGQTVAHLDPLVSTPSLCLIYHPCIFQDILKHFKVYMFFTFLSKLSGSSFYHDPSTKLQMANVYLYPLNMLTTLGRTQMANLSGKEK